MILLAEIDSRLPNGLRMATILYPIRRQPSIRPVYLSLLVCTAFVHYLLIPRADVINHRIIGYILELARSEELDNIWDECAGIRPRVSGGSC
ncbi:hypothetical protein L211DRAFT_472616 [Terfezia boudieri ATCC MYA-4762]|uniref:Uncharacterized protein n=1 Tax=Terfezia boudieri ATCC MYA-4762 TaxID=1051890 RepID=A0A3N4LYB4_9PEZI|nr:hypothetical protein L211DRAFT_472616 [Terfezia boudieri ATCC MYA-4762]